VHVVAADELDPPDDALLAVDPEQGGLRRTLDGAARAEYRRAYASWMDDTAAAFRAAGVRYFRAETGEPAARVVRRVASEAGARGR